MRQALGAGHLAERVPHDALDERFLRRLDTAMRKHAIRRDRRLKCLNRLRQLADAGGVSGEAVSVTIQREDDIVHARAAARTIARAAGFDHLEMIKVVTAVSEIARNIYHYARPGTITLRLLEAPTRRIEIEAIDKGPGIANLEEILRGGYQSSTGLGLGLLACQRLMDEFDVDTSSRGTRIRLTKLAS
jgi:anti-sigma regulatory factor (Ser/Thr protein kinase)